MPQEKQAVPPVFFDDSEKLIPSTFYYLVVGSGSYAKQIIELINSHIRENEEDFGPSVDSLMEVLDKVLDKKNIPESKNFDKQSVLKIVKEKDRISLNEKSDYLSKQKNETGEILS